MADNQPPLPPSHFLALPRTALVTGLDGGAGGDSLLYHGAIPGVLHPAPTTFLVGYAQTFVPDTSTLAAHDFDVDNRTGFMPPEPPVARLPQLWDMWEDALDRAVAQRLQLGEKRGITEEEKRASEGWRASIRQLPVKPISNALSSSEILLRRAHLVLAWIMHFYIHTLPANEPIVIPAPISIPLLQVSDELQMPPVLTYSDDVLYNWNLGSSESPPPPPTPSPTSAPSFSDPPANLSPPPPPPGEDRFGNWPTPTGVPDLTRLRCTTTFTATRDESEFYLTSARMELRGVQALALMRSMMDELFVADAIAVRRVTQDLVALQDVVRALRVILLTIKDAHGCAVDVFYHVIRPWFRGEDSSRRWVFAGLEQWNVEAEEFNRALRGKKSTAMADGGGGELLAERKLLEPPKDLSGVSAGQSTLIHALDVFLGVRSVAKEKDGILAKMQRYMPRHHRAFLRHLMGQKRNLRRFVASVLRGAALWEEDEEEEKGGEKEEEASQEATATATATAADFDNAQPDLSGLTIQEREQLRDAYNGAVRALKELRDAHMIIVALYILAPARRLAAQLKAESEGKESAPGSRKGEGERGGASKSSRTKGTGGTDVVKFLKGVRDLTTSTMFEP